MLSGPRSEEDGGHALATDGHLETVCRLCYLLGLATRLVAEAALTGSERRVIEEELTGVVDALRAHILGHAA